MINDLFGVQLGGFCQLGIDRGGFWAHVPEQHLNSPETQALFEKVSSKAVS